ncbi:hypothetical protein E2C01_075586 [Portunus trituberculatus]|uniref:Uncharacterized protein n=1 Tax=Portunus trituberculatus TaxID=210409 RepID=A0A5B7IG66_PORTR|nr:hypothetical protein [Portunus trituberculatus]
MIVNLCHRAGFYEVDDDDVQDLLQSHGESLSNDELIELDKASQEADKEGDEEEPVIGLDIKTRRECLGGIEKALETLKERDPNPTRSSKVAHDVENQSDMPSLSHLPTLLQVALPHPLPMVLQLALSPYLLADPATADPSTSASDIADDDVLSSSAHSAEDE